jgi:hypothetical protein
LVLLLPAPLPLLRLLRLRPKLLLLAPFKLLLVVLNLNLLLVLRPFPALLRLFPKLPPLGLLVFKPHPHKMKRVTFPQQIPLSQQ